LSFKDKIAMLFGLAIADYVRCISGNKNNQYLFDTYLQTPTCNHIRAKQLSMKPPFTKQKSERNHSIPFGLRQELKSPSMCQKTFHSANRLMWETEKLFLSS